MFNFIKKIAQYIGYTKTDTVTIDTSQYRGTGPKVAHVPHAQSRIIKKRRFVSGDKVIAVNNEDEPYRIGIIQRYELITKAQQPMPVVKFEGDDEEYMCFAHLCPYSEELEKELNKLSNICQWNSCVHDFAQLKTHKGISYKTYECPCESCTEIRRSSHGKNSPNGKT